MGIIHHRIEPKQNTFYDREIVADYAIQALNQLYLIDGKCFGSHNLVSLECKSIV